MSFAGHALDMIKKMELNRQLRKANRDKIKGAKNDYLRLSKNHKSLQIKRKDIPEEKLEKIKTEIRADLKKQRKIEIIATLIIAVITLTVFVYFSIKII